jgi:hypothetical protein
MPGDVELIISAIHQLQPCARLSKLQPRQPQGVQHSIHPRQHETAL